MANRDKKKIKGERTSSWLKLIRNMGGMSMVIGSMAGSISNDPMTLLNFGFYIWDFKPVLSPVEASAFRYPVTSNE
ncbi:MAG: hypothetical protein HZA01_04610 [Nitrospinae bacterium]|nr:hypothetical protein [Nitrospinota bacterium]